MFVRGGRHLLRNRLHFPLSRFRHSRKSIKFNNPSQQKPFTLRLIVPPSDEPKEVEFDDTVALNMYVKSYGASLCVQTPNGGSRVLNPNKYMSLSPNAIYVVSSPYFPTEKEKKEEPRYSKYSARAFEDKSRHAMIRYLVNTGTKFKELDRVIKHDGRDVAEWEGVFQSEQNTIFFLECKHIIRDVKHFLLESCVNLTLGYPTRPKGTGKEKYGCVT